MNGNGVTGEQWLIFLASLRTYFYYRLSTLSTMLLLLVIIPLQAPEKDPCCVYMNFKRPIDAAAAEQLLEIAKTASGLTFGR